jgi:hypothetical protein
MGELTMIPLKYVASIAAGLFLTLLAGELYSATTVDSQTRIGLKIRIGGRFDNVRMCVASPAGAKGGIAADISAFAEFPVRNNEALLHVDLPLMRPILFAFAFRMLQFEPTVTLKFSDRSNKKVGWVGGPALGVSLHYGPDYHSEASGSGRTESFFALGPIFGGYAGLDFRRPDQRFNFQFGLSPYITPLYSFGDTQHRRGVVIGGLVDGAFRFKSKARVNYPVYRNTHDQ